MKVHGAGSSIDVVIHAAPDEWWQVLAALTPLAALLAMAAVTIWYTFRRTAPDNVMGAKSRSDSWDRAVWAIDMALDDKPERRRPESQYWNSSAPAAL